jgi:hypothetical protein
MSWIAPLFPTLKGSTTFQSCHSVDKPSTHRPLENIQESNCNTDQLVWACDFSFSVMGYTDWFINIEPVLHNVFSFHILLILLANILLRDFFHKEYCSFLGLSFFVWFHFQGNSSFTNVLPSLIFSGIYRIQFMFVFH